MGEWKLLLQILKGRVGKLLEAYSVSNHLFCLLIQVLIYISMEPQILILYFNL